MVFLIALLIIMSCYVSVSDDMSEDTRTTYFATVTILSLLIVVFSIILG